MRVSLTFDSGTVRIDGDDSETLTRLASDIPAVEFDPRSATARAPAFNYAAIRDALTDRDLTVEDHIASAIDSRVGLSLRYDLREYQQEALAAWETAGDRGVIELPTGSGKTVLGLAAIASLEVPTLVVVPTLDLLDQWRRELSTEFEAPVGQFGGGTQQQEDLTVSTYDSAYLRAEEVGGEFGLLVFDEVHHLGGEGYQEIARLFVAPARLGLTATFERPDDAHETIAELVGPRVYALEADTLAGEHLANYEIRRIEVELSDSERKEYETAQGTFLEYLRTADFSFDSVDDYQELVKRSGTDPKAREALLAKQRAREIMMNADGKLRELERIFQRHRQDRIIVFTAHTDLVYRLSRRFLIPAITNETGTAERRDILSKFREGTYSRVVTANVLDEGIDVPDASVGVVLSGSGSEREFTQRLGRLLRPSGEKDAILYELVSTDTAEERVADRRR